MWFLRSHSESYQGAAFLLLTFDRIWVYYSSMYHYWYGVWFGFLVLGIILKQFHSSKKPKRVSEENNQRIIGEIENDVTK